MRPRRRPEDPRRLLQLRRGRWRLKWAGRLAWLEMHLCAKVCCGPPSRSVWHEATPATTATPRPWPWGPDPSVWSHATPVRSAAARGPSAQAPGRPLGVEGGTMRHLCAAGQLGGHPCRQLALGLRQRGVQTAPVRRARSPDHLPSHAIRTAAMTGVDAGPRMRRAYRWWEVRRFKGQRQPQSLHTLPLHIGP